MTEATVTEPLAPLPDGGEQLEGNLPMAVAAGLAAAVVGALVWGLFVYVTNYELGIIAIVVGAVVGWAVRKAGGRADKRFGLIGAVCAALGWALGTLLCDLALVAKDAGVSFGDAIARLGAGGSIEAALQSSSAIDLLFLAIAVWEGYKFAKRR